MNLLFSDRTPFVVALLVAVLSWQANELYSEIRSGRALVYQLIDEPPDYLFDDGKKNDDDATKDYIALKVINPSRDQEIGPFSFSIACRNPSEDCLTGRTFFYIEHPAYIKAETPTDLSKRMTMVRVWDKLPPGAILWLVAEAVPELATDLQAFKIAYETQLTFDLIIAENKNSETVPDLQPVRLIKGDSAEGRIATGWIDLLIDGIYWTGGMIFVWFVMVVSLKFFRTSSTPDPQKSDFTGTLTLTHADLEERITKLEKRDHTA